MKELIIKPTDSLNVIWYRDRCERLLYKGRLYKWCSFDYGHWTPEEDFRPCSHRNDGLDYICRPCSRQKAKETAEKRRLRPILLEQQDYLCKMCDEDLRYLPSQQVQVDHNFRNKVYRGVLCKSCNGGMPNGKDTPEFARRQLIYLETDGEMGILMNDQEKIDFVNKLRSDLLKDLGVKSPD